ncbi:AAA domain-containing protein [Halovenus rubra]|uniref:AAA domain-containing protein n=2 Tax=Halovenus rubra TaxID=869890 RepID=A0ACC7E0G7_9EURY
MHVRGVVVDVAGPNTVSTQYGESELLEVTVRPDGGAGEPTVATLWGDWTETAEYLESGMEMAVYDVDTREYRGEKQYTTGKESMVVVEPEFLVNVTDVRSWVQCPRLYYLNKLDGADVSEPLVKGTIVHEVFGDLLRGADLDEAVDRRIEDAGLDLGLLGADANAMRESVKEHAGAIEGWLQQGRLTDEDEWRSEQLLISERYGLKGRADAVRRGAPVELKTGKNTNREPRFQDKVQAGCYALLLGERESEQSVEASPDTGTLLYTKNAAVDRDEQSGDLSPAKDFSISAGFLQFILRARNHLAAMEAKGETPTGYEGNAKCEYCFEQDTCMAVSGRLDQESKAGQVGTELPADERDYFGQMYAAIEEERREIHHEYVKLWEQSPAERADADRALVDLEPTETCQLDDGRWELRAKGTGAVSKIRTGDVVLASDGDPVGGGAELARVERLGTADGEDIVVTADEPVDLHRLDVYPSELTTDRLLTSLHDALLTQPPEWKDPLFERREPAFDLSGETFIDNNEAQDEAVTKAVGAEDFALVHGPPGTGKTYTLARIVAELLKRDQRVLVSAFTNRAVDNAVEALESEGVTDIVRYGTESGVRDDMQEYRLEQSGKPAACAESLQAGSVVAATTASCGSRALKTQDFDVAIVDEAGQLTEPGTLAAIARADRFVLVGDHQQLPPVVQAENDLQESLFERLIETYPAAGVLLDRQYRMSQRIQAYASNEFYDGQLRPATGEVAGQRLDDLNGVSSDLLPSHLRDGVTFIDPDGHQQGNTNPQEAETILETVTAYLNAGVPAEEIGVIAPFRAQVAEISKSVPEDVAVDTVDRFQGSSKEVIIVSFVATGSLDGPIFEDYRRINVALTRAKKALVLIGDADTLSSDDTYLRMVDWAR